MTPRFPSPLGDRLAARLGGEVDEIDAGHDPMLSQPEELAPLLAAGSPAARTG